MRTRRNTAGQVNETQQNTTKDLSQRQQAAINALLRGSTMTDAAKKAKVDRTTLYRWIEDPEFEAVYNRERRDLQATLRRQMSLLAEEAVDTVRNLLTSEEVPASVRLRAAMTVLERNQLRSDQHGPTDPEKVRRLREARAKGEEEQLRLASLAATASPEF